MGPSVPGVSSDPLNSNVGVQAVSLLSQPVVRADLLRSWGLLSCMSVPWLIIRGLQIHTIRMQLMQCNR